MAREAQPGVHGTPNNRGLLYRQMSAPAGEHQVPVVAPGNLQCPLEIWIQDEQTPLLSAVPKIPSLLPSKPDCILPEEVLHEKDTDKSTDVDVQGTESSRNIACQVFVPFMIAGFGTVAAGLLLDNVQNWNVFQEVPEMFVLVPALLGLKGNLEMTLASRISTLANLGAIDDVKERWTMAFGNLSLLQCQSLVLGFIASMFASVVGWIREKEFNIHNSLLLTSSSMVTASAASFLLGSFTIAVVVISRKMNINPDNVAAPIAASLGDVVTLALLACISRTLFTVPGASQQIWIESFIVVALFVLIPMWAFLSYKNPFTKHVLYSGWIPIISAVGISSGGGFILNFAVARFKELAACQPVINGVGGNLVAVQACRISTYLHLKTKTDDEVICVSPFAAWFGKNVHSKAARILILIAIPGHLVFISTVHLLKSTYSPLSPEFVFLYLTAALLQIALLLYMAHCFVHWLWKWGFDPDDAAIPYLTAFGDLLGTGFLFVAFIAMEALNVPMQDTVEP